MIFCTLTFAQMAHAFTAKSFTQSAFKISPLVNKSLTGAVLLTFVLQFALIYLPVMQGIFDTVPLTGWDLLISIGLGSAVFWAYETKKLIQRRRGL
jgi:Ca2+-transporting ATPase